MCRPGHLPSPITAQVHASDGRHGLGSFDGLPCVPSLLGRRGGWLYGGLYYLRYYAMIDQSANFRNCDQSVLSMTSYGFVCFAHTARIISR